MLKRTLLGAAIGLGAIGAGPGVALAHPLLLQAAPPGGLVAPKSPAAIRLALTEPAVARGSAITLTGPAGRRVATSEVVGTDGGKTLSVTPSSVLRSAVYKVRWSALGSDGHSVSGTFSFGVAGSNGSTPPGAERLGGPAAGGRGGESAAAEGAIGAVARWIGILAASLLFAGAALVAALRRRGNGPDGADTLRQLAPLAWLLALVAASEGLIAGASSGAGDSLDLGLLTGSPTGRAELARASVVVVVSAALVIWRSERRRDLLYAGGGAAVLLTYALSGHVLSNPSLFALVDQSVHVLAAGLWLGGVIALAIVSKRGDVRLLDGARAFGPLAGGALGLAIITGVLAAIREVDHWYFLRWSDYGRVVIAKSILVIAVAAAGAVAAWRSRRPDSPGPWPRLVRGEAFGVLAVLALAATLSGLAQGRGQALPAERGSLLPGAAFSTALLSGGSAAITLAPARDGANVITVLPPGSRAPSSVDVRLVCNCASTSVRARLRRGPGNAWSAAVNLPAEGPWYGYIAVAGKPAASPVQLAVGVPSAPGADPVQVLAVADLSGAGAARCRTHVIGLQIAIGRINAEGGLEDGHKVAALVLDSGGNALEAERQARRAIASAAPIALAGVCGDGGEGAVSAAAAAGLPSIVGDPSVAPDKVPNAFRLAADPYAEGVAMGQVVLGQVKTSGVNGVDTVRAVIARDAQGNRRLEGLRAGLAASQLRVAVLAAGSLAERDDKRLGELLDRRNTTALILDGPRSGGRDAAAVARFGRTSPAIPPASILASGRVLSETFVQRAGSLGRLGVLQAVSEVSPKTRDGILYSQAIGILYRGERASLDGLRGYVTGLALRDAVRDGTSHSEIAAALTKPGVFSDALLAPWSRRQPAAGSPSLVSLVPQFLPATLIPASAGGESFTGTYFPDGSWGLAAATAFGLKADTPAPPLGQP